MTEKAGVMADQHEPTVAAGLAVTLPPAAWSLLANLLWNASKARRVTPERRQQLLAVRQEIVEVCRPVWKASR